jgi:hypothetical protein
VLLTGDGGSALESGSGELRPISPAMRWTSASPHFSFDFLFYASSMQRQASSRWLSSARTENEAAAVMTQTTRDYPRREKGLSFLKKLLIF